jgi:ubiquinone/menaquinone biosynthesis C-methylase UbiE
MPFSREAVGFYDRSADLYDSIMNIAGTAPTVKSLIKSLKIGVREGGHVLDLGCGTGLATSVLLKKFPNAQVSGLDYSAKMLQIYSKRFPTVRTYEGDFNDQSTFKSYPSRRPHKFKAGSFDLVISSSALSEYGELGRAVPIIHGLLRDDGVLVNIGIKETFLNKISSRVWKYNPANEHKFIRACEQAGFSEIQSISIPTILFPSCILKYAVKARK